MSQPYGPAPGARPLNSDAQTSTDRLLEEAKRQNAFGHQSQAFFELTDRNAPWCSAGTKYSLDRLGDVLRISAVHFVMFHLRNRSVARDGVGVVEGGGHHASTLSEIGLEVAGLDERDLNGEGADLVGECFGVALEGKLAGAVERLIRQSNDTPDRSDHDDPTARLASHYGQQGVDATHRSPEVRLQLCLRVAH